MVYGKPGRLKIKGFWGRGHTVPSGGVWGDWLCFSSCVAYLKHWSYSRSIVKLLTWTVQKAMMGKISLYFWKG